MGISYYYAILGVNSVIPLLKGIEVKIESTGYLIKTVKYKGKIYPPLSIFRWIDYLPGNQVKIQIDADIIIVHSTSIHIGG